MKTLPSPFAFRTVCSMGTYIARLCLLVLCFSIVGEVAAAAEVLLPATMKATIDKPLIVFIDPVKQQIEGWTVYVDPALLEGEHAKEGAKAIQMLKSHLFFISLLAPERRLEELRTLEIWIERKHASLTTMAYHPSAGWLTKNGHDPRLEKKVHIPIASQLLDRRQLMKHPMVILHELAHSYHDQILGFNDLRIKKVFAAAKKSGTYNKVLSDRGQEVEHYALSNHKEYFAESTEAYFNRNDFYPFVQAELEEHDPKMHSLMMEIWGDLRKGE